MKNMTLNPKMSKYAKICTKNVECFISDRYEFYFVLTKHTIKQTRKIIYRKS